MGQVTSHWNRDISRCPYGSHTSAQRHSSLLNGSSQEKPIHLLATTTEWSPKEKKGLLLWNAGLLMLSPQQFASAQTCDIMIEITKLINVSPNVCVC